MKAMNKNDLVKRIKDDSDKIDVGCLHTLVNFTLKRITQQMSDSVSKQ